MTIEEKIATCPKGRFTRLTYKSEVPLKAEYKKAGWTVTKITETTGRFVNYEHIKSVIERRQNNEQRTDRKTNYSWVDPHKISYNSNTGKKYISMATCKIPNTKVKYVVTDPMYNVKMIATLDEIKEYVLPSYIVSKSAPGEVRTIALDNVLRVANEGRKCF